MNVEPMNVKEIRLMIRAVEQFVKNQQNKSIHLLDLCMLRKTVGVDDAFKQGIERAEQFGIDSLKFVELEVKKQPTDRGIQHLKSQIISYIIPIAEKKLKQKLSAELGKVNIK